MATKTNGTKAAPAATTAKTAPVDSTLDTPIATGNGGQRQGLTLSSLASEDRNAVYLKAGTYMNEVLNLMVQENPDLLIGDIASVLSQKCIEKQFSVTINPTLRALQEYMGLTAEALLNEVAQISNIPRRYLGFQKVEGGVIFKINTLNATPKLVDDLARSIRTEYSTVLQEEGFKTVRDKQRAEGQARMKQQG